jgi:preprotein translocase subunit SecF
MADKVDNDVNPHKFRHLIPPGSSFNFVSKFKISVFLSCVAMAIGIGSLFFNKATRGSYMNWTTDFKGGTEIVYSFTDDKGKFIKPDLHLAREALKGEGDVDVSDMHWHDDKANAEVDGFVVRAARYGATTPAQQEAALKAVEIALKDDELQSAHWSSDNLILRSGKPVDRAVAKKAIEAAVPALKVRESEDLNPGQSASDTADTATAGESKIQTTTIAVWGLDKQYKDQMEKLMPGTHVTVVNSYGIGEKAGAKLRNDAAKSLIYAIFLIMLYLAFRFDIRYAPGAAFATIHDAVMVVGVFSITWTEVSLTSVAAVLTVIGYSVNDTVIVFDRIRENQAKLKDKKLERIIDISINEMLVRTVLTSMTVFVVTLAMNILGDGLIRNFAFAMNIGVIVGTYSSIFLAAPLFLWVSKKWYSGAPTGPNRNARAAAVAAEP